MSIYSEATRFIEREYINHVGYDLYLFLNQQTARFVSRYEQRGWRADLVKDQFGDYWYRIAYGYTPSWSANADDVGNTLAGCFLRMRDDTQDPFDWSDASLERAFSKMRKPPHPNLYPLCRIHLRKMRTVNDDQKTTYMLPNSSLSIV